MNCTELQGLLCAYLGGRLEGDQREAARQHVESCPACREMIETARNTTCKDVADFLGDYVEGELPEAQAAVFEQHVGLCPPCLNYLDSYRATIRLSRSCSEDPLPEMPEELVRAILEARRQGRD
jgi:anti-sigma factor RsiW